MPRKRQLLFKTSSLPAVNVQISRRVGRKKVVGSEPATANLDLQLLTDEDAGRVLLVSLNIRARGGRPTSERKIPMKGDRILPVIEQHLPADYKDPEKVEKACEQIKEFLTAHKLWYRDEERSPSRGELFFIKEEDLLAGMEIRGLGWSTHQALSRILQFDPKESPPQSDSDNEKQHRKRTSLSQSDMDFVHSVKQMKSKSTVTICPKQTGTIDQLVEYLTSETISDIDFRDTFVLTHSTFVEPLHLLRLLKERWNVSPNEEESSSPTQLKIFQDTKLKPIRIKVYSFLKSWAEYFPLLFEEEQFHEELQPLLAQVAEAMGERFHIQLEETLAKGKQKCLDRKDLLRYLMRHQPCGHEDQADFVLQHHPEEIAQQIALIDHTIFCNIEMDELLMKRFSQSNKQEIAPHVVHLTQRFNATAGWVSATVVGCISLERRVAVLNRMIAIAFYSYHIGNHFAGIAMTAALDSTPLKRLTRTWDRVDDEEMMMYCSLRAVYSPTGNYQSYRELLKSSLGVGTPYIGLYLRDLTFTEDGNPDTVEDLINFKKKILLSRILTEVKRFQAKMFSFTPNPEILPYVVTYVKMTDDEIYETSCRIEPKIVHTAIEELVREKIRLEQRCAELREQLSRSQVARDEQKEINATLRKQLSETNDAPIATPWRRRMAPVHASHLQRQHLLTRLRRESDEPL